MGRSRYGTGTLAQSCPDPRCARTMLHIRPRSDGLARLLSLPSNGEMERAGPAARTLSRVEEHIDANLDSALEIDELAALSSCQVLRPISPGHSADRSD